MGVAVYILPEKKLSIDSFVNGKPVAGSMESIDALAIRLGVPVLDEFMDPEEVQAMLDELEVLEEDEEDEEDEEPMPQDTHQWFDPIRGLVTIDALVQAIQSQPDLEFEWGRELVLEDLQDMQRVLNVCVQEQVRFRLSWDF